jgi:hypothetical protein
MSSPPEHASLESEWTATIEEAVASLAQETAAQAEQAGIEAGAPAEDVPGRPELGEDLRKDLADELVQATMAFWATGIPQIVIRALPGLIIWWIGRRASRAEQSSEPAASDDAAAGRLLEIDGRFFATMQASQEPASRRTVRELSSVREEYAALLDADVPSYLAAPARRSLADASEWLARGHASRGETKAAAREYLVAEEAWERVGDEEAASRCRTGREDLG